MIEFSNLQIMKILKLTSMYYTRLQVICDSEFSEILMAEIAEAGFDTFMENEGGFEAYVEQDQYDKIKLDEIKEKYAAFTPIVFHHDRIEKKNWNEEWEKSYEPILVDDRCLIRAGFHIPEKKHEYEIIITPKMSFGTGHHQTTYLMVKNQMAIDHQNKKVMDAGCGTAILSIMASKLGAQKVEAFDLDEWSVINGNENVEINQCKNISIQQGKISDLTFTDTFDIILANINKNILLEEMHQYAAYLNTGGLLLLSGFYEQDIPDLLKEANRYDLRQVRTDTRESWAALLLQKA
jgi:ribosomal protein L11 methyltransferase